MSLAESQAEHKHAPRGQRWELLSSCVISLTETEFKGGMTPLPLSCYSVGIWQAEGGQPTKLVERLLSLNSPPNAALSASQLAASKRFTPLNFFMDAKHRTSTRKKPFKGLRSLLRLIIPCLFPQLTNGLFPLFPQKEGKRKTPMSSSSKSQAGFADEISFKIL